MSFPDKSFPPYKHQTKSYIESRDLEGYALCHEMGCGKSRVVIDTAAHLFLKGEIERAFETTETPPPSPQLRDSFRAVHPEATNVGTFNGFRGESSRGKIDYVFVSAGVKVISTEIVQDNTNGRYPSDHFPVTATIILADGEVPTNEPSL